MDFYDKTKACYYNLVRAVVEKVKKASNFW